ncbi:hypothetical protein B0T09DRAFT_62838 [Sordaria sp. MPI-SDFR-AT-0083]|nr:hypothetical protein B0T09DRAFT_62838 [Sordaria sp. MPI-SDFR-AT-0083]
MKSSLVTLSALSLAAGARAYLVDPPTTAAPDTAEECSNWMVAENSSTCEEIAEYNWITVTQLKRWNPSLGASCSLVVGQSYCTEKNWGAPEEEEPETTTTVAAGPTTTSTVGNGIVTPTPTQEGMIKDCNKFHFVSTSQGCATVQSLYGLSWADFYRWNPAVGANCETLWANTNVCVGVIGGASVSTSVPATATTTAGNGIATPSPTQAGMVGNCNKFHFVSGGQDCPAIQYLYGITFDQLLRWNPAIGASCQGMWANTYLCVGTTTDQTTLITSTKTTVITTSKPTTTAGNGISTPQPIQTGIPTNCDKFHTVVAGDECQAIANKYSVSLSQFYAWNPAIGTGCSTLWAGYNVCVHTVGATTIKTTASPTSTGNGIATPTPTQPGMVGNCKRFHQVASGDTCEVIASKYGTTSAKIRSWNTQINSACTNTWLGYYVCVGV